MLEVYAQIDRIGVDSLRLRALVDLIGIDLRCTRSFANGVVHDMGRFAGRVSPAGVPLEPAFPVVASALGEGLFSFDHARVIAETIEALPEELRTRFGAAVEERLVAHTPELNSLDLQKLARRITALLDEDGPEPKEETQYRRRGLQFSVLPDGSSLINGRLTPGATAVWSIIFASLAQIRNLDLDEDGNLVHGGDALGRDQRAGPQQLHDAFAEAGELLVETGELPDHAGLKADLIVTIDLTDLEQRTGRATTHHGGTLTTQQLLHLAADLNVIPAILDQELGFVEHGRGRRLASPIQRKVIFARDRGCTFPGCDRPAGQSQVHHMNEWLNDLGQTNPDNLTLACGYHNNKAPRQGWKASLIKGIPHWTPPAWRDPEQKPRRNYLHHPELVRPD